MKKKSRNEKGNAFAEKEMGQYHVSDPLLVSCSHQEVNLKKNLSFISYTFLCCFSGMLWLQTMAMD